MIDPRTAPSAAPAAVRDRAGFILLDLVLAVAVLAAVAALAWPMLPRATSTSRLAAYAEEVGLLIDQDRIAAVRGGAPVAIRIDPRARRIVAGTHGRVVTLPRDVAVDAETTEACVDAHGVVVLAFSADGRSCGLKLSLTVPRRRATVEVDWLTGGVTVRGGGRG